MRNGISLSRSGLVAAMLLFALPVPSIQAQGPAKQRWEYASVNRVASINKTTGEKTDMLSFVAAGKKVEAKSSKDLAQKLGKAKPDDTILEVFNALGADGWELATADSMVLNVGKGTEETSVITLTWTFKRPK
jgi:hypothetical protein